MAIATLMMNAMRQRSEVMMPLPSVASHLLAPRRGAAPHLNDACEIITAFPLATGAAWPSAAVFTFVMTSLGGSLAILLPGALRHGERQGVLLPSRSPWSFHVRAANRQLDVDNRHQEPLVSDIDIMTHAPALFPGTLDLMRLA
jgi:hypothetical protein